MTTKMTKFGLGLGLAHKECGNNNLKLSAFILFFGSQTSTYINDHRFAGDWKVFWDMDFQR